MLKAKSEKRKAEGKEALCFYPYALSSKKLYAFRFELSA
jgi:hypothetical protein